jgi:hypothetical protein
MTFEVMTMTMETVERLAARASDLMMMRMMRLAGRPTKEKRTPPAVV